MVDDLGYVREGCFAGLAYPKSKQRPAAVQNYRIGPDEPEVWGNPGNGLLVDAANAPTPRSTSLTH